MKYINKSALVAEIERRISVLKANESVISMLAGEMFVKEFRDLLSFIDTLKVKDEIASNESIKALTEALRMEYEKGRADVLRVIDPDEMVADFCSQPLSKTRSLASIYRQGIIDIVKRINNNEETSITSTRSIDDVGL